MQALPVKQYLNIRRMTVAAGCLIGLLAWGVVPFARAQPGSWDASFESSNVGGRGFALQADGKILTAGNPGCIRLNRDGSVDRSFAQVSIYRAGLGGSGNLFALTVQDDGKILLGGVFDHVQDQPITNIARLHPDGTLDPTFQPQLSEADYVGQIVVQPDGDILVGGVLNLVRLQPDGVLDDGFLRNLGGKFVRQPDGKILIANGVVDLNGVMHGLMARLNADGSLDSSFHPAGIAGGVSALALQSDGGIVVAGSLTVGTNSKRAIVRLAADGSLDTSFNPSLAWQASLVWGPRCIAMQHDGRILVGLDPDSTGSIVRPIDIINRLMPDGSFDRSFRPNWLGDIGPSQVDTLVVQPDGQILMGGRFPRNAQLAPGSVARINGDAAPAIAKAPTGQEVIPGDPASFAVTVTGPGPIFIQWQKDGQNLIGETNAVLSLRGVQPLDTGDYTVRASNGTGAVLSELARLTLRMPVVPGSLDTSFDFELPVAMRPYAVSSFVLQSQGNLVVAGFANNFFSGTFYNRVPMIWQIDPTGGLSKGVLSMAWLQALATQRDGKVLVAYFMSDHSVSSILRVNTDGTRDGGFRVGLYGVGCVQGIKCMAVQTDGKVLVGGRCTSSMWPFDTTPLPGLERINADGSPDGTFRFSNGGAQPATANILTLAVQPDDRIVLGGDFTEISGGACRNIARLHADGGADATFDAGAGANGPIQVLALDAARGILIGGDFTLVQGRPRNHIARLLPDGQLDLGFDPGAGTDATVTCLAVQTDGKVWLGGAFTHVAGTACNRLARLNPDGTRDTALSAGTGTDGPINAMALQTNGDLLIGGDFSSCHGVPRNGLARLHGDPAPAVPLLSEGRLREGLFSFRLRGMSGGHYSVRTSANLVDWQGWTNVQLDGTSALLTDSVATNNQRLFYRAVANP